MRRRGCCYLLKKTVPRSSRARVHLLKAVRNYTRKGRGRKSKGRWDGFPRSQPPWKSGNDAKTGGFARKTRSSAFCNGFKSRHSRDKKLCHTRYFINYDLPLSFFVDATFQKIKTWSKGGKNLIFFLAFLMKYRPLPSGVMQRRRCKFHGEDRKRRGAAAAPAEKTF